MNDIFTIFWVLWILSFLLVEAVAILRRAPGDTLSEHVWSVLTGRPVLWFLFSGFMVWLTGHFLLSTWSGF